MKNLAFNFNNTIIKKIPANFSARKLILTILADKSASMGDDVTVVQNAINDMLTTINNDSILKAAVELMVISVGDKAPRMVRPLSPVSENEKITIGSAAGFTPLGEAILLADEKINARLVELKTSGSEVLAPIMVALTDGNPCGSDKMAEAVNLVRSGAFTFVPVAIGEDEHSQLAEFGTEVYEISNVEIPKLFQAVTSSTKASITTSAKASFDKLMKAAMSWSTPAPVFSK